MPSVEITGLRRFFTPFPSPPTEYPYPVELLDPFTVGHIRNVLRMQPGDRMILVDATSETPYLAKLVELQKQRVTVQISEKLLLPPTAPPAIALGVGMIKEQHWDWLIQKSVELGVRSFFPLQTQHTAIRVHDPEKKQQRWQAIAQAAAEQSESLFIPPIQQPHDLEAFVAATQTIPYKLILRERDCSQSLQHVLQQWEGGFSPIVAAIGPTGGWATEEAEFLIAQGFQPVSLGTKILRTETAAISLMSILSYEHP